MLKKLILGLGAIAVIVSLSLPVMRTENFTPSNDGSIIFTWNPQKVTSTDWGATASRTLAVASGAMLLAFVLPGRQRK